MGLAREWRVGGAAEELRRRPMRLVDIGARFGLQSHWAAVGQLLDVMAFEPDIVEARRLEDVLRAAAAAVEVIPTAVWDSPGRKTLYLTRQPGCSSLYPPNEAFLRQFPDSERFDVMSRVEVETSLLDTALAGKGDGNERPCRFIKIDAQGGALPILSGAEAALGTCVGVELEVEMTPMYVGEPLFADVDAFLRARGFELIDLRPTYWRRTSGHDISGTRGQLIFSDVLYMISPIGYAERLSQLEGEAADHLNASALLTCHVFGLADRIAAYVDACSGLTPRQRRLLVAPEKRGGRPSSPMRFRLGQQLKDAGDWLIEGRETWAVAEMRLGSKARLGQSIGSWLAHRLGLAGRNRAR